MNKVVRSDGTVGKALEVLDLVAGLGRPVRFSELLALSDQPKATLYRFLQTLTNQGMLAYNPENHSYTPGLRLLRLAHSAWQQSSLAPVARPFLDELASKVREAVHLAQLDNGHVLFVDKRKTAEGFDTLARAGKVAPLYCTGVGKAILAHLGQAELDRALDQQAFYQFTDATLGDADSLREELREIKAVGFAYDREEHEQGIISIAAPILVSDGTVIGALSIATSTNRHDLQGLDQFQAELKNAAINIGHEAGNWLAP